MGRLIKDITIDVLRVGPHTEMILIDGIFYTPDNIYQRGMMCCNLCGNIMSIDKKFCPACMEWVICIREEHLETEGRYPKPKRQESRTEYISRAMSDQRMQAEYPKARARYNKAEDLFYKRQKRTLFKGK